MKLIAFYLPQFHTIPENDEWWGKGFTEWTNVKKAKPLFKNHVQPKVPLDENYYNLLDDNVKIWQADLAKKYGIYGFCYYHYWYNGKLLLEKPMEQMLANKKIDLPFCIMWCNHPWTKSWIGNDKKILISQKKSYRNEWIEHYNYLKKFFLDERYIKESNCPLIGIYSPIVLENSKEMLDCWNELAKLDGLNGIKSFTTCGSYDFDIKKYESFDYIIEMSMGFAREKLRTQSTNKVFANIFNKLNYLRRRIYVSIEKYLGIPAINFSPLRAIRNYINSKKVLQYDCDEINNVINNLPPFSKKSIPSIYVNWDNTSRYGRRGFVFTNYSPEKFEKNLLFMMQRAKNEYNSEYLFVSAWNEWAEFSVLEPEKEYGYGYLEAVKRAIEKYCEDK